jgi:hypothetical protein
MHEEGGGSVTTGCSYHIHGKTVLDIILTFFSLPYWLSFSAYAPGNNDAIKACAQHVSFCGNGLMGLLPSCTVLTLFWSAKHSTRTVAVPSAQGQTVRGLVRGAVVLSARGRTVRGLGPDGPRPGARLGLLPDGRTVRAYAGTTEDRRRRLDLAPGRDPVGE